ncbi:MAG: cellulase family glycosylhydrolase [Pyrinomonadaceae bacterium]
MIHYLSILSQRIALAGLFVCLAATAMFAKPTDLVTVRDGRFYRNSKPYYFVGTNYWYGSLLGLEKDRKRGIERLRRELDFLKSQGVTNLRLMAGAEGTGLLNGVPRVGPPLQPEPGKFDAYVLDGLDLVLHEMGRRKIKAVIFLSNNWEWSGGFQQYLIWNKVTDPKWLTEKPSWDELRDNVAKFYSCKPCKAGYRRQVDFVLARRNKLNKLRYVDDPTIMAWELANEPRPMRPTANADYAKWIADEAAHIRSIDRKHLITTGHEGRIGTESLALFEQVHDDPNIDYLTIHIWPKNWGWFANGKMAEDLEKALKLSSDYIAENSEVAQRLNKPMVIEEFGMPRDGQSFDIAARTTLRDRYFERIFSFIDGKSPIAGANFWAFGGTARPIKGQPLWKAGDERMGDPPMEEQGLNSVFDSDASTWNIIRKKTASITRNFAVK